MGKALRAVLLRSSSLAATGHCLTVELRHHWHLFALSQFGRKKIRWRRRGVEHVVRNSEKCKFIIYQERQSRVARGRGRWNAGPTQLQLALYKFSHPSTTRGSLSLSPLNCCNAAVSDSKCQDTKTVLHNNVRGTSPSDRKGKEGKGRFSFLRC